MILGATAWALKLPTEKGRLLRILAKRTLLDYLPTRVCYAQNLWGNNALGDFEGGTDVWCHLPSRFDYDGSKDFRHKDPSSAPSASSLCA